MKLFSKFFVIVVGLAVFSIGTTLLLFYAFTRSGPATFLLGASLAVLLTMGAALVLGLVNHQVIEPIRVLTTAVSRVTLGDLRQMVPVRSSDEVGKLSRDFNDMILQLAATHRQLSEATQAADERRAQLESSINGLRQGFILTNARGRIVLMNEAAKELLHASKSKIKHPTLKDFAKLLPAEIKLESDIEKVVSKQERMRFASLPFSGHFLNLYLSPVATDGEALGCVLLFEDVTEERILQRSRDEFFSIASHELRTPLTAIRGNITLIEQYFPQIVKEPDVKEMLDDIHESSIRLIDIVNDFLDVSRLEQNRMKFDMADFTVEPVIEKVIYEMGSLSHDKGIYLEFDQNTLGKLPLVRADQSRVKQILYNLIGNAMKFTQKGGVIINCLVQGGFVKITVSDTGPGISLEGQQLLFHKFQQTGDSIITRDSTRGTGLGLYISKLLIEHMGGEIKLEHTELGKGSVFSVTLPVAKATKRVAATAATKKRH